MPDCVRSSGFIGSAGFAALARRECTSTSNKNPCSVSPGSNSSGGATSLWIGLFCSPGARENNCGCGVSPFIRAIRDTRKNRRVKQLGSMLHEPILANHEKKFYKRKERGL